MDAGHNISPRLRKQLVLELEGGKVVAEVVERLPSRIFIGQVAPLNQHAPDDAALLCLQCPLRILQDPTIQDRWKRGRGCRRIAAVLLQ